MRREKLIIIGIAFVLTWISLGSMAQSSFISAGDNISSLDGSVSYSMGQMFYQQTTGSSYLIEGVQQPYEISVLTDVSEVETFDWKPEVFPNPVQDLLSIKLNCEDWQNVKITLQNTSGQVLADLYMGDLLSCINMSPFSPGVYFLHVQKSENQTKVFKIIKN